MVLAEPLPESTLRSSFTLKERFVGGTAGYNIVRLDDLGDESN